MHIRIVVIGLAAALSLSISGCKKEGSTEAPSGGALTPEEVAKNPEAAAKKAQEALEKGDVTALATSKTGGGELNCDALIPQALRDKYMKGATITAGSMVNRTLMCSGNRDGRMAYHVTYDCRPTTTLAVFKQEAEEKNQPLAGPGRAAFGSPSQLEFYDDDADCHVTVSAYTDGETVTDLAKDLADTLKPSMLPPLEKGKYTLDCDKLVPEALRAKYFAKAKLKPDSIMKDQMKCEFTFPDFNVSTIDFTCGGTYGADFLPQMKDQFAKQKMTAEDVKAGAAPALYTSMMGSHTVTFVDPETGCLVSTMMMKGEKARAVALASEIESTLTVDAAK